MRKLKSEGTSWLQISHGFLLLFQLLTQFLQMLIRCLISQCQSNLILMQYNPSQTQSIYMIYIMIQEQIIKYKNRLLQIIQGKADCALELLWIRSVSCLFSKSTIKCFRQKIRNFMIHFEEYICF